MLVTWFLKFQQKKIKSFSEMEIKEDFRVSCIRYTFRLKNALCQKLIYQDLQFEEESRNLHKQWPKHQDENRQFSVVFCSKGRKERYERDNSFSLLESKRDITYSWIRCLNGNERNHCVRTLIWICEGAAKCGYLNAQTRWTARWRNSSYMTHTKRWRFNNTTAWYTNKNPAAKSLKWRIFLEWFQKELITAILNIYFVVWNQSAKILSIFFENFVSWVIDVPMYVWVE